MGLQVSFSPVAPLPLVQNAVCKIHLVPSCSRSKWYTNDAGNPAVRLMDSFQQHLLGHMIHLQSYTINIQILYEAVFLFFRRGFFQSNAY